MITFTRLLSFGSPLVFIVLAACSSGGGGGSFGDGGVTPSGSSNTPRGGSKPSADSNTSIGDGGPAPSSDTCTSHAQCDEVQCRCTSGFTVTDYYAQSCDLVTHRCKTAPEACPVTCAAYGLQWVD